MQVEITGRAGVIAHSLVSPEDFERVNEHFWNLHRGYACNSLGKLHTFIMGPPRDGFIWDHKNKVRLDNRRENLREATPSQNAQNSTKRKGTSSVYIGVCRMQKTGTWHAVCKGRFLGSFTDELHAGKAYDTAALFMFGEHAQTNDLLSEEEIEHALSMPELQVARKKKPSVLGLGIRMRKSGTYHVSFDHKHYGAYKTLEEAQEVSKKYMEDKNKSRIDTIFNLDITRNQEGVAAIPLRNKKGEITHHALVDDEHWHDIMTTKWYVNGNGYAAGSRNNKNVSMHQYIFNKVYGKVPLKHVIDHRGRDEDDSDLKKLDNRAVNLRALSVAKNGQNRLVVKGSQSKYLGVYVSKRKNGPNKWRASISFEKKLYYLGSFDTEEQAADAYNKKALELYGPDAKFNQMSPSTLRENPSIILALGSIQWSNSQPS